jgi:two-component system, NtrC family, sensor kinase
MSRIRPALQRALFLCRGGDRLNGCDDEHVARGFHLLLTAFLVWTGIMVSVVVPLFAVRKVAGAAIVLALGGFAIAALVLLRRDRKRAAAALFLTALWCLLETFSALSGGIHGGSQGSIVVIIVAAWLLDLPIALGFAAVTVLLSLAEALLEYSGHPLPVYFPGPPLTLWAAEVGLIALTIAPVVSFVDALRRHVAALRNSEERFRSLSDSSLEGIMIHDRGMILDANRAFARIFGYEHPDELIGRNSLELLLSPESRARIRERWERRETGLIEVTGVRRDGTTFPGETESRVMRHRGHEARLVAMSDITERKRAMEARRKTEEELRESKGRLEEAQQLAHLGSYTSDVLTGRMEWSDELYRIFELDPAESVPSGDMVLARAHPDDRPLILRTRDNLIRRNGRFELEHRLLMPDGRIKHVQVTGTVSPDGDGRPRTRATVQDITERKRAEQERANLQVQLNQAQKMESIGQLAAGIAHEINTPIQYIGDNGKFLEDAFRDLVKFAEAAAPAREMMDEGVFDYLRYEVPKAIEQLLGGVDHVARIVLAMKEFSHPGSAEKLPVDINRAIESTVLVSKGEWKYLAELTTDFDPELPRVPCFAGEFNQVILNLIVNAAHAIADVVKDSGRMGRIHITTLRDGDVVEIRVSDTGCGIARENQSKVFDPFFTTKPVGKGTGQGLAIAYGVVVQKHGGAIRLESEPGSGATFIIRLPLVPELVAA